MLGQARLEAIVPVSDLERSIQFYGDALGLGTPERDDMPGNPGARFDVGGSSLYIYESVGAGQSRHTIASFDVDDAQRAVETLKKNGVVFEEYDLPNLTTEGGIATMENGKFAWFKDPDGNILVVGQTVRVGATA